MNLERPWGSLHYRDEGAGPLVVLLHPLAVSGALWQRLVDEIGPGFRVVTPDARGHGGSTWDGAPFTIPDLADDVAALVEHLDAGPARVAGMSMGGCTAIALAVRHAEIVERLGLADTTADYGPDKAATWSDRAAKAATVPRREQLGFQVDRWFSAAFREQDPAEVERIGGIFTATDSAAHAAACAAMGAYDDSALLGEISSPTLVLVGEEDYATPPAMAAALHAGIAGSTLHVLPGVRHLGLVESPEGRALVRKHFADQPLTADLYDAFGETLDCCDTQLRQYGSRTHFRGVATTVRVHDDNILVKEAVAEPGHGRVLVVDGGGSCHTALLGENMARTAAAHGWEGIVIHGAVRDVAALRQVDLGIKAVGANPRRSRKERTGLRDVPVSFGGATFTPGAEIVSDEDGVVVRPARTLTSSGLKSSIEV